MEPKLVALLIPSIIKIFVILTTFVMIIFQVIKQREGYKRRSIILFLVGIGLIILITIIEFGSSFLL